MGWIEVVIVLACYFLIGLFGLYTIIVDSEIESSMLLFSIFPIYLLFTILFVIIWGVVGLVRTVKCLYFERRINNE